jgi:hypothetical protein
VFAHTHTHRYTVSAVSRISLFAFLMLFSMTMFGQNYGTFSTSGGSGNVSLGVWPGWLNTNPYTRLGIYTADQHGMEINVTGSGKIALSLSATANNSKALQVNGQTYLNQTYVSSTLGIGLVNSSMASHEKLAVRNGMITTSGTGNGISLNGSYYGSTNSFGTQWYGLFWGDANSMKLSTDQTGNYTPVVLSSFYGLGFEVGGGKMALCQNGALVIGSDNLLITDVADLGTNDLEFQLYVEKGIRTEKVKVDAKAGNWPDFVFEDNYNLPSLTSVENYINENKHLPNVPSAAEVEQNGVDLGEMDKILLQKVEELTLYMITQQKLIVEQQKALELLQLQVTELKSKN